MVRVNHMEQESHRKESELCLKYLVHLPIGPREPAAPLHDTLFECPLVHLATRELHYPSTVHNSIFKRSFVPTRQV